MKRSIILVISIVIASLVIVEANVTAAIPQAPADVSSGEVVEVTAAVAPGDVNGDGRINIFDLLGLLKILAGINPPTAGSDINLDGTTNIFDLIRLLIMLRTG